ncbi:MAG TPA: hypothetical protein VNC50_10585 [Planctomycetia bacterium]|nr:hypothetical protein [Planctomycetia bacterium]
MAAGDENRIELRRPDGFGVEAGFESPAWILRGNLPGAASPCWTLPYLAESGLVFQEAILDGARLFLTGKFGSRLDSAVVELHDDRVHFDVAQRWTGALDPAVLGLEFHAGAAAAGVEGGLSADSFPLLPLYGPFAVPFAWRPNPGGLALRIAGSGEPGASKTVHYGFAWRPR